MAIIFNSALYSLLLLFAFFIAKDSAFPENKDDVMLIKGIANIGTLSIYLLLNIRYQYKNRWKHIVEIFENFEHKFVKQMMFFLFLFLITIELILIVVISLIKYAKT